MIYPTKPKYKKYVKGYGFLSFAKKFGIILQQKTGIDAAKAASEKDKTKSKEKENEANKKTRHLHTIKKRQQFIDDLRLF